jgi:coronin-1B/1C/6
VGNVRFNPIANNILLTASTDFSVKVWDIQKGSAVFSVDAQHVDIINSAEWNSNGSMIATSCKDKKLRVIDPRQSKVVSEVTCHEGIKGSRAIWIRDRIFTAGFSKGSEREFAIWDPKNISKPLATQSIDSASGSLMPFFDTDNSILYLAGKGDGNIRYFEVVDEAPYIHYLAEFKSNTPQRGMCLVPKRMVNVSEIEIARILKVGVKIVEPISMQVPRKSDIFQDDLYPDCFSGEYSLTADDWIGGKNAEPKVRSMAPGFVATKKNADFVPEKSVEKVWTKEELEKEVERLNKRVSFLEVELVKKEAKIKELEH